MKLGTRLTMAFLAVALIPAGVIVTLTWFTVEARFEEEFNERLDGVAAGLRSDLDQLGRRIGSKVQALAEGEEVERILVDMVRGSLDRRSLIHTAAKWMRTWEFDMLNLLDGRGQILSCGNLPARFGESDAEALAMGRAGANEPRLREVLISREGRLSKGLAVAVGTARKFNEAEVVLVGGRLLDESFVTHLEKLSSAQVVVVDKTGQIIAAGDQSADGGSGEQFVPLPGHHYRHIPLGSQEEGLAVTIVAGVSRTKLESAQHHILLGSLLAALGGVVISLLLGILLSRRTTRPVELLVRCARAVATGDLSPRVKGAYSAEMGELVASFNQMVTDLQSSQQQLIRAERVAAWREIARRIAHEIKNPLSPIQVSIETMRKAYKTGHGAFPEIFEESTRAILEEVGALKRIVSEFSDFARLPKPMPALQDLNPVVESVVKLFDAGSAEISVSFEPSPNLPQIEFDKELIGQVLNNLLTNAVQASSADDAILVRTGTEAQRAFISIRDQGKGMTPEVLEKVFTPYFTTRQDGTGLGLAIVQRIVDDHGGAIEIASVPGSGTEVTVFLPGV